MMFFFNRKYQQRLPYELLSDLANCLIEDTVGLIVKGLADIQKITEQTLYERRQKSADALKLKRIELVKRLKEDQSLGLMASEQASRITREFDRKSAEELHRFDMKTVMDLDQLVSEQQVTLEKTGVPGFHVTNNPVEIQLQMYIISFITRLSEKKPSDSYY